MAGHGQHNDLQWLHVRRALPTTHYKPYDLDVVPRAAVDPAEHFVISATGVVCILGGLHSDHTALLEWDRERRAYDRIRALGFFRNFINQRAFRTWRKVRGPCARAGIVHAAVGLHACMLEGAVTPDMRRGRRSSQVMTTS